MCLNILREDWRPVLDVNAVIYGLIQLFGHDVNSEYPLNREAAALLQTDRAQVCEVSHEILDCNTAVRVVRHTECMTCVASNIICSVHRLCAYVVI